MQLRCGNLKLKYENGFIRYIMAGNTEALRMIYFAVRDQDWATVPGKIINEQIEQSPNHFVISYEMLFQQREIRMHWVVKILGNIDNTMEFEIRGRAETTFKKNRAGFCVLHPIKECIGKKVTIQHADGSHEVNYFPEYISPHQPFRDIASMSWEPNETCKVLLQFEGDVFETEDHRNWTDNNFKTYCTPLDLPFPATLHAGDEVIQRIRLKVEITGILHDEVPLPVTITALEPLIPLPSIGIARSSERNENYLPALEFLSLLHFSHYRADINLSDPNWEIQLREAMVESQKIKAPLEIALFVNENTWDAMQLFMAAIGDPSIVKQIALLHTTARCINNSLFKKLHTLLASRFRTAQIGAGTDNFFTDLNRSDLSDELGDFVQYSLNPQVHAFDNSSLIENMEGQAPTVQTALYKYKKAVHVSPVTLKMRKNPDATGSNQIQEVPFDERQASRFAAGWTVGSLKYLIEAGVSSITYYEATGKRGLCTDDGSLMSYPVLEIFKAVCGKGMVHARKTELSHPLLCTGLIVGNQENELLIIANHDEKSVEIEVENLSSKKVKVQVNPYDVIMFPFNV